MQGLHLTADLHHCQCDERWLTDADALLNWCERSIAAAGLQCVARLAHRFASVEGRPAGVTASLLLAESHVCVHTWPELRSATLDVYVCNFGADHSPRAHALLEALLALFAPGRIDRHEVWRGDLTPPAGHGKDQAA